MLQPARSGRGPQPRTPHPAGNDIMTTIRPCPCPATGTGPPRAHRAVAHENGHRPPVPGPVCSCRTTPTLFQVLRKNGAEQPPSAVHHLDTLRVGPLADLGAVRPARRCPATAPGWPPRTAPAGLRRTHMATAHPAAPGRARRSGRSHTRCRPAGSGQCPQPRCHQGPRSAGSVSSGPQVCHFLPASSSAQASRNLQERNYLDL